MFEPAFKRLFLILLPLFFIALAFFIISKEEKRVLPQPDKTSSKKCDLLLGASPFSTKNLENQNSKLRVPPFSNKNLENQFLKPGATLFSKLKLKKPNTLTPISSYFFAGESYFLSKEQLLKSVRSTAGLSRKQVFFVLPLVLNKEEEWIVSEKVFLRLAGGERKEISQLSYEEILNLQNSQSQSVRSKKQRDPYRQSPYRQSEDKRVLKSGQNILSLETALLLLPKNSSVLFRLLGSDRPKIIKNLGKALSKIKGTVYISSSNERLLNELSRLAFSYDFEILRSYKSLIRLEMLSVFPSSAVSYKSFKEGGVLIPSVFSMIDFEALTLLKQKGKLLFFEKDPPYTYRDKIWLEKASALISSKIPETLKYLQKKTNCF